MQPPRDEYQTINTFTRSLSLPQVVSYLLVVSLTVVFFAAVQGNYQSEATRIAMITVIVADLLTLVVACLYCSKVDPVDPLMINYRNGDRREVGKHIQDCLYCDVCRSYVKSTSRHCKLCNRCVNHFDHHCSWINNCIGQQNYKCFFVMILTALFLMVFFCLSVGLLYNQGLWRNYKSAIIADWFFFAIALLFSIPLLALVCLHIYLSAKGLTTFQFIMERRQSARVEMQGKDQRHQGEIRHQAHNITSQEILENNNNHQSQANRNDIVIFQRMNTEESSGPHNEAPKKVESAPKPVDSAPQYSRKVPEVKPQQTPMKTHDNSEQLRSIFKTNRSLKYLIGNDVLIQNNHNPHSYNREYHTIRPSINRQGNSRNHDQLTPIRYRSQGPKRPAQSNF